MERARMKTLTLICLLGFLFFPSELPDLGGESAFCTEISGRTFVSLFDFFSGAAN